MIKQVIIMSLQDKCFGPNLETIKNNMKIRLEDLNGKVNGLQNLKVQSDCLKSSNSDVFVELTFENEEALKNFKSNEDYNAATKEAVVPFVASRTHVEFEM